eukprot:5034521-Pyramimonas_sp.AAC.1
MIILASLNNCARKVKCPSGVRWESLGATRVPLANLPHLLGKQVSGASLPPSRASPRPIAGWSAAVFDPAERAAA